MAFDRHNAYIRLAIWQSYDRRCPYCTRLVEYEDFQIDHVIPRAIIKDVERYAALAQSVPLPSDFDPEGLENAILSCRPCNGRKSGGPQEDGDLRYTLKRARDMIPRIMATHAALLDKIPATDPAVNPASKSNGEQS